MDAAELAAWTAVANVLLNLDGVLTKGLIPWTCYPQTSPGPDPPALPQGLAGGPRRHRPGGAPRAAPARPRRRGRRRTTRWRPRPPHFAAKAKRVIYLHMAGAPPQLDLFDYKPKLVELNMQPCPDELLKGQRFAFIKGHPEAARHAVQVRAARPERRVGQRAAAALRASIVGRRRGRQVDEHRPVQPRPGRAVPLHRLAARRRGGDGLVGHLRPGHRRTRTCPASSS